MNTQVKGLLTDLRAAHQGLMGARTVGDEAASDRLETERDQAIEALLKVPTCSYLEDGRADGAPCENRAVWFIVDSSQPQQATDACTEHVGALLSDGINTVYPLSQIE